MCLLPPQDCYSLAQELVGRTLYVGWPYLAEAKVCAVSDGREKYHDVSNNGLSHNTVYVCIRLAPMHVNTSTSMYVHVHDSESLYVKHRTPYELGYLSKFY